MITDDTPSRDTIINQFTYSRRGVFRFTEGRQALRSPASAIEPIPVTASTRLAGKSDIEDQAQNIEKETTMKYSKKVQFRIIMVASAGLTLALAGCATATEPSQTASETTKLSVADKTEMRAECKVMHENMMAKKAEGKMPGHKMMTPEMMEKHQTCMELMPEMRAEMQAKCEAHKAGGMQHDMMSKEKMGQGMMDRDHMHQMCAMMDQDAADVGE